MRRIAAVLKSAYSLIRGHALLQAEEKLKEFSATRIGQADYGLSVPDDYETIQEAIDAGMDINAFVGRVAVFFIMLVALQPLEDQGQMSDSTQTIKTDALAQQADDPDEARTGSAFALDE